MSLPALSRNISVLFKAVCCLRRSCLAIQATGNSAFQALEGQGRDAGRRRPFPPDVETLIFMPMMVQMVRVGEETGNLDATLLSVAQSYEAEAQDKTKAMISMIQPVMTVVIGLVVGLMALSLVSAMYSMYSGMG
jgi:hypothetical protein